MSKKIVAGVMAVVMVFGIGGTFDGFDKDVFTVSVSAEEEKPTSGKCGENLTWEFKDGTLTISGTGEMNDFPAAPFSEILQGKKIVKVVIEKGVTSIGYNAFRNCKDLTEVEIPDTVKSIGDCAFIYSEKLTEIKIPYSVTSIELYSFSHEIFDEKTKKYIPNPLVISGYKNSAAEKYSKDNGFTFAELKKEEKKFSKGDVNLDGDINVTDIAMVASHIKGIKALIGDGLAKADVNDDVDINVTDIAMIASHIKGIKAIN